VPALPTDAEVDAYIASKAPLYGINPTKAIQLSRGERQSRSTGWVGDHGSSFGPFQLHIGGIAAGGNAGKGLGDVFKSRTGLDPRNIAQTWQQQVDFSLDWISKHGWDDFHYREVLGFGTWDGISRAIGGAVETGMRYFFPVVGYKGNPRETYHTPGAADLFAPEGTDIRAVADGRVSSTSTSGPGGNALSIVGLDGLTYYYAHMKEPVRLAAGDFVGAGQKIGLVGKTGNAANTAPHLHLGIGYGISTGTGPAGGAGEGFDAQTFLSTLLQNGGSDEDAEGVATNVSQSIFNLDVAGQVKDGLVGAFQAGRQGLQNYVQNRAATLVLAVGGVLVILFSLFALAMRNDTVKTVVKAGASKAGIPGMVAASAL
jgi:murein DD-endopeptidase MepM/ murein hydrolase activator NlpD